MATEGDSEAADPGLSDVEGDDSVPIVVKIPSPDDLSVDKFQELLAELDRERQTRMAAEKSMSELQGSFSRLKILAHEAIKKRDECSRQRDEALREKEEILKSKDALSVEFDEVNKAREEVCRQKNEIAKQLEEAVKVETMLQSEMDNSRHMLVTGIEKISGKVSNFKDFSAGGLPRSQKYTGFPAIAYGVIKRTNEIVEELVRQVDAAAKSRHEAREQVEQRNYEIAIEVSQLEATINFLREEISKKTSDIGQLDKLVVEKDAKIAQVEREMSEKLKFVEKEGLELRQLVEEYENKLRSIDLNADAQRPLLIDQLNYVSKIQDQIYDLISIFGANKLDQLELSRSMFIPQETDMENLHASLEGMGLIYELTRVATEKTRELVEEKNHEVKKLNERTDHLVKEKECIGSLLRSTLSKRILADTSSKTDELSQVAENGSTEAGIDCNFNNLLVDRRSLPLHDKMGSVEENDEIYTLAGALANIVKESQLQIIELQHHVEELRAESSLFREHVAAQVKELNSRKQQIKELEEKERVASESVEGLMMDIAASEEEITRWKVAAEQEAAAGKAVEQDYQAQLSSIHQEMEEAKQAMAESEKKLKFREETAAAAMAARDAAEKSLRMADARASRLRDRVEELTRQLEQFDTREDFRGRNRPKYACWPWQWLGLNYGGLVQIETREQGSNEMELSEPLL